MRFIHLSDLHFGRHTSPEKLHAMERDIRAQAPDLLVHTGDITDRGSLSQFRWAKQVLSALGVPFISVPGNREVAFSAVREWMFPWLAMRRYSGFFGSPDRVSYRNDASNTIFFGLNSVHPLPSWPGTVARQTRHWLREQANAFPTHTKVLFLHHPVLPVIRSSSFWAHTLSDAGELLNICTQTGITLILQGHKHRRAVMELSFPERDAKVVVSACGAPLMPYWDCAYHLIELHPSRIVVRPREYADGRFVETEAIECATRPAPRSGVSS